MTRRHASPPSHANWRIPVTHRHGTRHDRMMFVGGQADLDEHGNVNNPGDLRRQAETVLSHLERVLETLEGRLGDIVKINLFHAAAAREEEDELLRQVRKRLPPDAVPVVSL